MTYLSHPYLLTHFTHDLYDPLIHCQLGGDDVTVMQAVRFLLDYVDRRQV